jgi:3-deoxy-D-manno-octulosonic-acid transferase
MFVLYNILLFLGLVVILPYYLLIILFTGKYRKSIGQKFGFVPRNIYEQMQGQPRIWIHAVSVGEVTAAAPVISSLREHFPGACIVLSTGTETGQEMARKICTAATAFFYYPIDIPFVVRKVIKAVNPHIFILVETELWPHFIRICKSHGAKVIMVNGRISPRSFKRYKLTRFFWKGIVNAIDEIGVISRIDAERLQVMGAKPENIHVLGNAKYDSLAAKALPGFQEEIAVRLNMKKDERVLVAGSTHEGEDRIVFDVYRKLLDRYPDFKFIIIPRHPERGHDVLALAKELGFTDCIAMSDINKGRKRGDERVVVIDVIGELFKVYSLATVVFCGGSLVPRGGQNILEPAAWGKMVFYGPSMEDFREEKALLEAEGVGVMVRNGEELSAMMLRYLADPEELKRRGNKGRDIVIANMGAAQRYAAMIRMHVR